MTHIEHEFIKKYLDSKRTFHWEGMQYNSTLVGGLRELRDISGRKLRNGTFKKAGISKANRWIVTIGYLCILDQIGSCFKPKNAQTAPHPNPIFKAIYHFGSTMVNNNESIFALCALRHALAHDYCLVNIGKSNSEVIAQKLTHRFTIMTSAENWIVQLPANLWLDNIITKDFNDINTATRVNLVGVGNLVEHIYCKLIELNEEKQLEIVLRGGYLELWKKYCFVVNP